MALNKYLNHDWGDACAVDIQTNNEVLDYGERILVVYLTMLFKLFRDTIYKIIRK